METVEEVAVEAVYQMSLRNNVVVWRHPAPTGGQFLMELADFGVPVNLSVPAVPAVSVYPV